MNNDVMPVEIHRRGLLLVLSSPSGAGKSTLARKLLDSDPDMTMSVSVTTRKMRPGEVDGTDYHFISQQQFGEMRSKGELLESATVFSNGYGTPRRPVDDWLAQGMDVLFDIDWQGTQQLRESAREDLVSVFILPPTTRELERRLESRAQDSAEVVAQRMSKAADEMSHFPEYDYIVVNNEIATSVAQVEAILTAERLRRERQIGLGDFVRGLREG